MESMMSVGKEEKTLNIKQVKNGYVVNLSYCAKKGGMSGYHSEEYIVDKLPDEIEKMFEGKFAGKISKPEDRRMSFDKAEHEANEAPEKEEEEQD